MPLRLAWSLPTGESTPSQGSPSTPLSFSHPQSITISLCPPCLAVCMQRPRLGAREAWLRHSRPASITSPTSQASTESRESLYPSRNVVLSLCLAEEEMETQSVSDQPKVTLLVVRSWHGNPCVPQLAAQAMPMLQGVREVSGGPANGLWGSCPGCMSCAASTKDRWPLLPCSGPYHCSDHWIFSHTQNLTS